MTAPPPAYQRKKQTVHLGDIKDFAEPISPAAERHTPKIRRIKKVRAPNLWACRKSPRRQRKTRSLSGDAAHGALTGQDV